MNPVEPTPFKDSRLVIIAKDQPQYDPLPAAIDSAGVVMTEWEVTADELEALLQGGRIRLWTYTFNKPMQPIAVQVVLPACGMRTLHGA